MSLDRDRRLVVGARLDLRTPFRPDELLDFLGERCVDGVERLEGRTYARVVALAHGPAALVATVHDDHVSLDLELADHRDHDDAVVRVRRMLDLDVDLSRFDPALGADPVLARSVADAPGLRVPGQVDGYELLVRAVVGQQVSVAGARTVLSRITAEHGRPVDLPLARAHGLDRLFPTAEDLAELDPQTLPMPRSRARAIATAARAVAEGDLRLDPDVDPHDARRALLALPGIGPWTADYVALRALRDPDVLLTTDLVLKRQIARHALTPERTAGWSPWRSYASMHLWRLAAGSTQETS